MILTGTPLQMAYEIALHGGSSDPFPPAQTTPVDAIQVLLIDHLLEALTGSLEGLDPWQLLAECPSAIQTPVFADLHRQHATTESPVVVPHLTPAPTLVS
jgi:hypothetical protein